MECCGCGGRQSMPAAAAGQHVVTCLAHRCCSCWLACAAPLSTAGPSPHLAIPRYARVHASLAAELYGDVSVGVAARCGAARAGCVSQPLRQLSGRCPRQATAPAWPGKRQPGHRMDTAAPAGCPPCVGVHPDQPIRVAVVRPRRHPPEAVVAAITVAAAAAVQLAEPGVGQRAQRIGGLRCAILHGRARHRERSEAAGGCSSMPGQGGASSHAVCMSRRAPLAWSTHPPRRCQPCQRLTSVPSALCPCPQPPSGRPANQCAWQQGQHPPCQRWRCPLGAASPGGPCGTPPGQGRSGGTGCQYHRPAQATV